MCLLQAGGKPQTAMSHQFDGVDIAESQRNQIQKQFDTDGGDESSRKADANMAAFDTTPKTDRRSV